MVYRKLIKFGNSSHILSIPKDWIVRNKLKAGDVVHFKDGGHELCLNPTAREEGVKDKEVVIDIKGKTMDRVYNEIFSAYINSYNTIKIIGNISSKTKGIRSFLNKFVALEIVEQTSNKIVAKDFLNMQDISVGDMTRRMDIIVRSMFEDLLICLDNKKDLDDIADKIYDRDTDVNRLYFLLTRVVKEAINNPNIAHSVKLHGTELLVKWLEITYIEDVADEVKRVARFLKGAKLNKKQEEVLQKIYLDLHKMYLDSRKALYNGDKDLAHNISGSRSNKLIERCNDFYKKNHSSEIGTMLERVKKMTSDISNLAVVIHDN